MSVEEILKTVSRNCLHAKPIPRALQAIWEACEAGDQFVTARCGLTLLASLDALEPGYETDSPDPEVAANCRAHRRVWERLGFFAQDDNGGFLAFDLGSAPSADPPVVQLDSEGSYQWLGRNLAEAIFRQAEDAGLAESGRAWLAKHELPLGDVGEVGSSTQFLPSLEALHRRWEWEENRGEPRPQIADAATPARPDDPLTWMLRPAAEVQRVIAQLPGMRPGAIPQTQWFQCDGDGRIVTAWLPLVSATALLKVRGVGFGMSVANVRTKLGTPTHEGQNWLRYDWNGVGIHFEFDNHSVTQITLMVETERF